MGWLCGEVIGFLLLPVIRLMIAPRAQRLGLLPVTLPPFGLGLVLLPLFFLAADETGGFSWSYVFWFTPEVLMSALLILPFLRHRHSSTLTPPGF
jgi:hypothetical protein